MVNLLLLLLLFFPTAYAYPEVWQKIQPYELNQNKIVQEPLKINVNTADKAMLQKLTGIGPKKAQDILDYRDQNGAFKKLDDLQKVKGFTKKSYGNFLKNNKNVLVVE
jgi:comEA protein